MEMVNLIKIYGGKKMKQKYNKKQKAGFLVGLMILVALLIVSCISVSGFMREQASLKTVQKDTALSVQMYPGSPTISEFTWEDVSSEFCITCYVNTIEGTAKLCNNANAPGINVLVQSSSGSKSTTTGSTGYWQVDVGALTGGNWTWGIPFTVTYSGSCSGISWTGSDSGIVSSPPTCYFDCGTTYLSPLNPLTASASGSPTTILAGGSVSFTGSATGGYQPYVSWSWNFGGDGTSPLQNPTHTFNTPGTYNCILTVTDTCGNTDPSNPVVITVNPALSCDAGGPYSGTKCACVQLSGTPTGGIPPYSHSWDYDSRILAPSIISMECIL
jgi:PKD repeat protein